MSKTPNSPDPTDPERRPIDDAADAVSDGAPPDWESLRGQRPELSSTLDRLRDIQRIADFHRQSAAAPREVSETWGPLEIRGTFGEGAFGQVLRAYDPVLQREVALKRTMLDTKGSKAAGTAERLLDEARRLARVRHPNVVRILGATRVGDEAGIWMEPIEGRTLAQRLDSEGILPVEVVLRIGRDLAAALGAIHDADLVHGDVKAENVMEDPEGRVVLLDFGSARNDDGLSLDFPAGTPLYLAPEVLDGALSSRATDAYALGVLMFRLLTHRYPLEAADLRALRQGHRSGRRWRVSDLRSGLPSALSGWIDRLLQGDSGARPQNLSEFSGRLEALLTTAAPESFRERVFAIPENEDERTAGGPPWDLLPPAPDRFVGRRALLAQVVGGSSRTLTLVAPGGWGKSRLALESARSMRLEKADGVVWIDLRGVQPEGFWARALATLGNTVRSSDPRVAIGDRLRGRDVLLVLDNAESCPEGCRELVSDLVSAHSGIRLLVTSREPLEYDGETVVEVSPMSALEDGDGVPEAATLLLDRLRSHAPGREFFPSEPGVARVCAATGGVPLALELAAAQADLLSLEDVASELEEQIDLSLPEDGDSKSVAACLRWSYERLAPQTQRLLRSLAVLRAPWSVHDARALQPAGLPETLRGVRELAVRGFVCADGSEPGGGSVDGSDREEVPPHHRLPEPVRRFARRELELQGELDATAQRHRDYFLSRLSSLPEWPAVSAEAPPDWIERAYDDLADAWRSFLDDGDTESAASICVRLAEYWGRGARVRLAEAKLRATIEAWRGVPTRRLAQLQMLLGGALQNLRDHPGAVTANREGLRIAEAVGDLELTALGLSRVAGTEIVTGEPETARPRLERALDLAASCASTTALASVQNNLGLLHQRTGDLEGARRWYERGSAAKARLGDRRGQVVSETGLGAISWELQEFDRARRHLHRALEIQETLGDPSTQALLLYNLGNVEVSAGLPARACGYWRRAQEKLDTVGEVVLEAKCRFHLAAHDETAPSGEIRRVCGEVLEILRDRDPVAVPDVLSVYAEQLETEGRNSDAARLYAAVESLRSESGLHTPEPPRRKGSPGEPPPGFRGRSSDEVDLREADAVVLWAIDDASRQ